MSKPHGIAILIPSNGRHTSIDWAMTIRQLSFPVGMHQFWYMLKSDPSAGHTRDFQRETLADMALKVNAEFAMWIDDDTLPPPNAVQELYFVLSQNPKAGICGGIYCTKEQIPSPLVFMELGGGPHWQWTIGDVFKCAGLGTGCMMVRTEAFRKIAKPWFRDSSESKLGDTEDRGEITIRVAGRSGTDDLFFCKKVAEAGYDIIAHGGVLPAHQDYSTDLFYKLPKNSFPVTSYQEKLDKANATLPEGQKKIIL